MLWSLAETAIHAIAPFTSSIRMVMPKGVLSELHGSSQQNRPIDLSFQLEHYQRSLPSQMAAFSLFPAFRVSMMCIVQRRIRNMVCSRVAISMRKADEFVPLMLISLVHSLGVGAKNAVPV
jgi:hypothetical protein